VTALDARRAVAYTRRMAAGVALEIVADRVELIEADALLVPVDGRLCRLGGAAAGALRAALDPEERADELAYVEEELIRMRPIPNAQARAMDGVARWRKLVVAAAYPHNVDGLAYSSEECAQMVRAALASAIAVAAASEIRTLGATLIGSQYRMTPDVAVRAFVDGLAAARSYAVTIRWSLPDVAHRNLAESASKRLGLVR